ncbi:MAG: amidohydrolase, partial [Deltaproteobacteria bacterium]|nr:amidohydrolase [Deltaproteobacteria bacterium]
DLWQERLPRAFRDRAPHVIENPAGEGPRWLFVVEGASPFPIAGGFAAGRSGDALKDFMSQGYEGARPSGWDPAERMKDQEIDGIDAEVIYPTLGMPIFSTADAQLQRACFQVYNDWVAEYCRYDPKRLYGLGLISLEDIDTAVQDVEACAKQGMRGAMIWGAAPDERPYNDRSYDPFWQAASEAKLPLSLHIIASRGRSTVGPGNTTIAGVVSNPGIWYTTVLHEIQDSLAMLVFGGVLARFPKLRIVSAENDIGWFPHFLFRMDHAHEKWGNMWKDDIPLRPSEYVRRQVWATFQDDPIGSRMHDIFGAENYMWASDFPHSDSTFPESRAFIEKNFTGVPDAVRKRIVCDNAVALYGMEID